MKVYTKLAKSFYHKEMCVYAGEQAFVCAG